VEIANQLLSRPEFIKTPDQYLSVLTTGNLEPLYEFDRSRQRLIKAENEAMMGGEENIPVLFTDDDAIHVLEHACLLDSPEARKDPELVSRVRIHIQAHMDQAKMKSPEMAAMLKQTSFFMPEQPPPPGGPGNGAPPQVNPAMMGGQPNPQQQIEESASGVRLPQPAQPPQQ
jgi:hypothetical protein